MRVTMLFMSLAIVLAIAIQLLATPLINPPVRTRLRWDSQQTKTLVEGACMDCHSNETKWPWYGYSAPASWVITQHVYQGRAALNFSTLEGADLCNMLAMVSAIRIRDGSMPLRSYQLAHPVSWLTNADREQLIQGLSKTLAQAPYVVTTSPISTRNQVSWVPLTGINGLSVCQISMR